MDEQNSQIQSDPEPDHEPVKRRWSLLVLPAVWLILGGVGGYAIVKNIESDEPSDSSVAAETKRTTAATKATKKPSATTERTTEPTPDPTTEPTSQATRSIGVVVFNQIGVPGLAGKVAEQARAAGWTVGGVGDWRGSVPQDTIYFPAGRQGEAELLGADLKISRIMAAQANMSGTHLTVVLASPR